MMKQLFHMTQAAHTTQLKIKQEITLALVLLLAFLCAISCSKAPEENDELFAVHDGLAVIQGDIILGSADSIARAASLNPRFSAGSIRSRRWEKGIIPYVIEEGVSRDVLDQAISHIHEDTSIRFVQRTDETDYVRIQDNTSWCGSQVGRAGGEQILLLSAECDFGNVVHELGHVIGLFHEQNRGDRDDYVDIVWENVIPGKEFNFARDAQSGFALLANRQDVGSYDLSSVMQSPVDSFSRNGKPTIVAKNGAPIIGQRRGLSSRDKVAIANLYEDMPSRIQAQFALKGDFTVTGTVRLPEQTPAGHSIILELHSKPDSIAGASFARTLLAGSLSTSNRIVEYTITGLVPGQYFVGLFLDNDGQTVTNSFETFFGLDGSGYEFLGYSGGSFENPVLVESAASIFTIDSSNISLPEFGVGLRP